MYMHVKYMQGRILNVPQLPVCAVVVFCDKQGVLYVETNS